MSIDENNIKQQVEQSLAVKKIESRTHIVSAIVASITIICVTFLFTDCVKKSDTHFEKIMLNP
jgi:hypothetical protein